MPKPSLDDIRPIIWIAIGVILIIAFGTLIARAHDWYPAECCSQRDCFKINYDELVETNNGDWLYLPRNLTFPKAKVRPSQDRNFHVCIGNSGYNDGQPLCAFILQGT
jgi:hypothetical protein